MSNPKPKICVYAIALNEEKHLRRWYESVKDADNVVVCDTGSTDGTVDILDELFHDTFGKVRRYQISVKPWRFDTARNANLALVPPDIDLCICVDIDDVLEPGWRERLEAAWTPGVNRMTYQERNGGSTYTKDRIHGRHGFFWDCVCHEIVCADPRTQEVRRHIEGEFYRCEPDRTKDRSSYLPLLETECRLKPHSTRAQLYYARELMYAGQTGPAIANFRKYLSMTGEKWGPEQGFACRSIMDLLRAQGEDPLLSVEAWDLQTKYASLRESWVALANQAYQSRNWVACRMFARRALMCDQRSRAWCDLESAWSWWPWDFLALAHSALGEHGLALSAGEKALELATDDQRDRLTNNLQNYRTAFTTTPSAKRQVLSFSLWGDNPKYTQGMLENAHQLHTFYPGWTIRVACADSVPSDVQDRLVSMPGVQVIRVPSRGGCHGAYDRLQFMDYEIREIERVCFRDADSRFQPREVRAVKAWIDGGKPVHLMRDHPNHRNVVQAGMFGVTREALRSLQPAVIDGWMNYGEAYGSEERKLADWFAKSGFEAEVHDTTNGPGFPSGDGDVPGEFVGRQVEAMEIRQPKIRLLRPEYRPANAERAREIKATRSWNAYLKDVEILDFENADGSAPTFKQLLDFAASKPVGDDVVTVLANADIALGPDRRWATALGTGDVFALSRHEARIVDGKLVTLPGYPIPCHTSQYSQDAWCWRGNLREIPDVDFQLGVCACDNAIAARLAAAGLTVTNPGLDARIYHVHPSAIRTWSRDIVVREPWARVVVHSLANRTPATVFDAASVGITFKNTVG